jgi:triacylglycerol lipase
MSASRSRHLVDPELLPILDAYPTGQLSAATLAEVRAQSRQPLPFDYGAGDAKIDVSVHSVPGPAGAPPVPVRIYRPRAAQGPLGCVFHIHGGGFIAGEAAALEPLHRALVAELGAVLASVDYRLAPETRFPGAIEDCYAALGWLFRAARELGVDPARVGVMGESAGGGLAAALALMVRDRGQHRLAFQHLIYPMLDDRTCAAADPNPFVGEFVWTPHNNHFGWAALLGVEPGAAGVSPYAAPARATELAGLPPTFLSTVALDLFVDENIDYARRLARAGVPLEFHLYPGAFHGFDLLPTTRLAQAARRTSTAALARALNGVSP